MFGGLCHIPAPASFTPGGCFHRVLNQDTVPTFPTCLPKLPSLYLGVRVGQNSGEESPSTPLTSLLGSVSAFFPWPLLNEELPTGPADFFSLRKNTIHWHRLNTCPHPPLPHPSPDMVITYRFPSPIISEAIEGWVLD